MMTGAVMAQCLLSLIALMTYIGIGTCSKTIAPTLTPTTSPLLSYLVYSFGALSRNLITSKKDWHIA